jgi:hypothetical protein
VNRIGTLFWPAFTVWNGIPYLRFEPKSGCRCALRPMLLTQAAECLETFA